MSLFVTGWAWYIASGAVEKHASERFEFTAKDVANAITDRMNEYELALRSGLALFHASDKVSRKEWEKFADTLYLNKHFPGIQGLGYSQILKPEQVAEHEAEIQAEGFEEYQIKPAGERDMYSAIVFLEPFDWRNQRAFGYDMFSEPTRREAMERARDTADFAASGRVTLVQETEEDTQYGFLMYFPFYQQNSDLTSIQARREALQGYVYAAFRLGDLMKGVLNNAQQNINFELYEGSPEKGVLLHNNAQDKHVRFDSIEHPQRFQTTHQMNIGGQTWSLFVYSDTGFLQASELNQPSFIVVIGVLFDIVLFLLISYVVRGRNQAKDSEQRAWTDFRVSQQRLQLAADAGKMGLMEWNIIDNKLYWDDRMLALYGYNRDTIKDNIDFWQQCIHPEDLDNFRDELASARQFKQHIDMQFRIRTPQGRTKYIAASIIVERNNAGEATRMVGFNYDVTEQITNKQQIQEKNWRLQNLVDATDAGTWELNVQTGETQINYRWAEMLGYTLNDLMPVTMQTWLDLAHPDDREQTRHRMQSHFAGNANHYECVCRMRHKAGHWVWIKRRGKVFSWTDAGEPLMMFGTHHDISEQKQYEEILKTERDKAEAANRSRGEFLANMSHEIRTPINGVMGALDLLSDTDLSPSQFNLIGISRRSAESLLGLINDILDLSKIESGKLEIVEEPVELVSAMNDVARTLSTKAEAKNIALVCPSQYVDDTYVYADGLRLRQILTNLINNAIKFTQEGSVLVDLNVLAETNTNVHLRFNVTDTGQGIPYDKQKTLFERFQQVDSSLTR
ncbi:sensor histidine kinase, partial [Methylophaga sp.]|uniref:sensor histidine kinase n=1 Tax=Methylophaga sp. TaxID=2024840 RepID=UPI003F6A1B7B